MSDGLSLTLVALAVGLLAAWLTGKRDVLVGYLWMVTVILLLISVYLATGADHPPVT